MHPWNKTPKTLCTKPPISELADVLRMEKATQQLLERVQSQQEAATRISQLQSLCGGQPAAWDALEAVAVDVGLKAQLWHSLREWGDVTSGWRAERLFSLDAAAMEERVCGNHGWARGAQNMPSCLCVTYMRALAQSASPCVSRP
jgi:hypothetical protein